MLRSLLLIVLLFLAACAAREELVRPAMPVPRSVEGVGGNVPSAEAAKVHWRSFFTDPTLQALIESALDNNRDLRIAVARVREARAQYESAKAGKLPQLSLGPQAGTPMTAGSAWPFFSISYELDFWGRVASLTESSLQAYLGTEDARRTVQLSLIADVANAYFELVQIDESLQNLDETVSLRGQAFDLVEKSRALGVANGYEYEMARGALESSKGALAALQHQRNVVRNRLVFLTGRGGDAALGKSLADVKLELVLPPAVSSEVLLLRPDVAASEHRLRAAHANVDVARAAYFPRVSLAITTGNLGVDLAKLFDPSRVIPFMVLPALLDGGAARAGVDAAEARKALAVAEYEKTVQLAFREVADQLSARASWRAQLRSADANVNSQVNRMKMAQGRYVLGAAGYIEVLDAQREVLAVQQSRAQVRRSQLETEVRLYQALGGGALTDSLKYSSASYKGERPQR